MYVCMYLFTCTFLMNTSGCPQAGWRGSVGLKCHAFSVTLTSEDLIAKCKDLIREAGL